MIKKLLSDKGGFTLIEMIITLAVTTIIMSTLVSMVDYSYRAYYQAELTSTRLNGVTHLTETIRKYTYDASEVRITSAHEAEKILEDANRAKNVDAVIYSASGVVYADGIRVAGASNLEVKDLWLTFHKDDKNMLRVEINALDEDSKSVLAEKNIYVYMANCENIIEGEDDKAIIVKKLRNVELVDETG